MIGDLYRSIAAVSNCDADNMAVRLLIFDSGNMLIIKVKTGNNSRQDKDRPTWSTTIFQNH